MRRVPAAVGRVHYRGNHDLPRVRLCEPRLYDQDTRTQARSEKMRTRRTCLMNIPLAAIPTLVRRLAPPAKAWPRLSWLSVIRVRHSSVFA